MKAVNKVKVEMFLSLAQTYRAAGDHDEANNLIAKANEIIASENQKEN